MHGSRGGRSGAKGAVGVAGSVVAAALIAAAAATVTPRPSEREPAPHEPATHKSGVLGRLDLALQRHAITSFPVAVWRKFSDDRGGRLAALIAYYGFFSLFPAMLALVTVLGFVLESNPDLRDEIAGSALTQFPIVDDSIASTVSGPLNGNAIALVIGLAGALWAGMGTVQACQDAMNEVWEVERASYPNFVMKRFRSLAMLALLAVMVVTSTGLTQIIQIFDLGPFTTVLVVAASLTLDLGLFAVAYRLLTVASIGWRDVLPGALFAAVVYVVLQYVGGLYIEHTVRGATDTYGTFAVVIGLLSWIFLNAQVVMFGAEINTVKAWRLWPRSLFGDSATAGDRRSHAAQATSQRMDKAMDVDVEFADRRTP